MPDFVFELTPNIIGNALVSEETEIREELKGSRRQEPGKV
jgi:hypothetical protein